MASDSQILIDVDRVIRDKMGDKARYVPRFVVSWLRNIIHQDQLNEFIGVMAKDMYGMEWLDECLDYLRMNIIVKGHENLHDDSEGHRFTFVSNHPLGGIDGVALGSILCHRYDSRIKYLVNDLLMNLKGIAPLFVPINKTGSQSRDFPALVKATFSSEDNIIMFPAGLCSRRQKDGSIKDLPWTKTFITKSIEYKRDVVPIHFSGQNSDKFYDIAYWCKKLNLKVNIAMLYLVDEMYKNVGKTFTVTIGQPIPWQTFDKSRAHTEWAQWVREKVYSMEN